jgi:uncharacterized protein (TIGR02452 family)
MNNFNPQDWLKKYRAASEQQTGFRELRAEIFEGTVEIVNKGSYQLDDKQIIIDGTSVAADTEYFTAPPKLPEAAVCETKFFVKEADCLETTESLLKDGLNPCVLNMASGKNPGGGVKGGAGAQEENIFRRTNMFKSLFQFADFAVQYGIKRSIYSYPLNRDTGGIYSKDITVFRTSDDGGYALLEKPFQVSFVSVPAINRPDLEKVDNQYYIAQRLVEPTKEKMRAILRIAGKYKHDALVLSAFGCGAFANPPYHIALLFSEVFEEKEFKDRFKQVVFSIIDDHNSHKAHNPEGNVLPFLKVFEKKDV